MDFKFFEQCDRFRSRRRGGEKAWQEMMRNRVPVDRSVFDAACDDSLLLDEYETLDEFMADDPDSGIYSSKMCGVPCFFVQVRGFEFIFLRWQDRDLFPRASRPRI